MALRAQECHAVALCVSVLKRASAAVNSRHPRLRVDRLPHLHLVERVADAHVASDPGPREEDAYRLLRLLFVRDPTNVNEVRFAALFLPFSSPDPCLCLQYARLILEWRSPLVLRALRMGVERREPLTSDHQFCYWDLAAAYQARFPFAVLWHQLSLMRCADGDEWAFCQRVFVFNRFRTSAATHVRRCC